MAIPLSPNYFDSLSEEEDASNEEATCQETESTGTQRATALNLDPKEKAPMPLVQQEKEVEEETLRRALHQSREEA